VRAVIFFFSGSPFTKVPVVPAITSTNMVNEEVRRRYGSAMSSPSLDSHFLSAFFTVDARLAHCPYL